MLPRLSRLPRRGGAALAAALLLALPPTAPRVAAEAKPAPQPRLRPEGIDGALVLCGGGRVPDAARARFVELAGGPKARLVIVPTAGEAADRDGADQLLAPWKALQPASAVVLHTRSRHTADDPKFLAPLRAATGVWFGGDQSRLAAAYVGTAFEKELQALLKRGGVIGGTSAGAAALSRLMIASGNPGARTAQGFDLLPGAVIDQHFQTRDRRRRLLGVLEKNPGLVGFGIDEGTALVVRGRSLRVLGDSTVTVCLAPSRARPARTLELKPGAAADLTQLRRAARARAGGPFPPAKPAVPEVKSGALVIVGGGGLPPPVTRKFIELAGGPEALIVVLPTAGPDPLPPDDRLTGLFTRAGARNVRVLRARALKDVEDPKNLELLKKAGGVWFGGGRQWRFVDAYEGTKAEALFRDVLRRGGVIGGSSAGASIQAEYLVRGSPLGNFEMMCEGYERGLGFLSGVAVDQHFSQRNRFADMTAVMKAHPQLLGIGIDEATALVVRGHVAEVIGRNKVQFYDRRKPVEPGQPDYEVVRPGGRYDLKARRALPGGD
jgi:cyanophycinase